MMLILISYYEYFNKSQSCIPIQQLLQSPNIIQLLDIKVKFSRIIYFFLLRIS